MSSTDAYANSYLDVVLGTSALLGATVYIGLLLATPNPDGTGVVEPSGGGYARVAVTNDATHWPAAAGRMKTHANDIVFPSATTHWGVATGVGIFSALSGGVLKLYDFLAEPRDILNGDQFTLTAGGVFALKIFA